MADLITSEVAEIAAPSPRVSGGVRWAPLGTPLPTDSTTLLEDVDPAYITLGRVKDEGIKRTEDRANTKVYDWGGNTIAILQTQFGIMVTFNLLQLMNQEVQSAAHGYDNVEVEPATATSGTEISIKINNRLLDTGIWVFESYYQKMKGRLVLPYARPTKVDGPTWSHKEIASYNMTLESMPDNDNQHAYEFWNDGVFTP